MPTNSKKFPHIPLELTTTGTAAPILGGLRKKNPITAANLGNRAGHGGKLQSSVSSIIAYWEQEDKDRKREDKPSLPPARRLILQIDPNSFEPESLKSFGIEVIAELEDGYIIGSSVDLKLTKFQEKIEKFIREDRGGGKVAEIWEIIEGDKKLEFILDPQLLEHWDQVQDQQIYTVDVGVACLGTKSQLPDYPIRKDNESNEDFSKRINNWRNKRNLTWEQWDELKTDREMEVIDFVRRYQGNIQDEYISQIARLPDSFTCRIKISGQGLKDLVFNFPYLIEVIAESEDGYIIGDSADLKLTKLQKKIKRFIREEKRSGKTADADAWTIIEENKRLESILDPQLLEHWDKVQDKQIYTVDVGVACLGTKSKLPDYPTREDNESDEHFSKRINNWINKRDLTYEEWDDFKADRETDLINFVHRYQGKISPIQDEGVSHKC